MVRLKVRCLSRIGRWGWISIPVWYDWKSRTRIREASPRLISIPVWYDWKKAYCLLFPILLCISIPVWYDWKWSAVLPKPTNTSFQFQYGTIESNTHPSEVPTTYISIPVWYDWKVVTLPDLPNDLRYFNSSMVRLKAIPFLWAPSAVKFQFQYGTIESLIR